MAVAGLCILLSAIKQSAYFFVAGEAAFVVGVIVNEVHERKRE